MRNMVLLRWSAGVVSAGMVPGGAADDARFGMWRLDEGSCEVKFHVRYRVDSFQAETRAADRVARYAARANRANAPPQQHHLAQGIALGNCRRRF